MLSKNKSTLWIWTHSLISPVKPITTIPCGQFYFTYNETIKLSFWLIWQFQTWHQSLRVVFGSIARVTCSPWVEDTLWFLAVRSVAQYKFENSTTVNEFCRRTLRATQNLLLQPGCKKMRTQSANYRVLLHQELLAWNSRDRCYTNRSIFVKKSLSLEAVPSVNVRNTLHSFYLLRVIILLAPQVGNRRNPRGLLPLGEHIRQITTHGVRQALPHLQWLVLQIWPNHKKGTSKEGFALTIQLCSSHWWSSSNPCKPSLLVYLLPNLKHIDMSDPRHMHVDHRDKATKSRVMRWGWV